MKVITLGVHVVDVLIRPVEEIPEGQGGRLVEQIRITPAGTARDAAVLGCAAAALVAQGLGSDHGAFDLAAADALGKPTTTNRRRSRDERRTALDHTDRRRRPDR